MTHEELAEVACTDHKEEPLTVKRYRKVEYKVAKYVDDRGLWTVIKTTDEDLAKVYSKAEACALIAALRSGEKQ